MTSDSTPVFALEKEALKTEIETGLQVGVDSLCQIKPIFAWKGILFFSQ